MTQHQADVPLPWTEETIDNEAFARDVKIGAALDVVHRHFSENFPEVVPVKLRVLPLIVGPSETKPSILDPNSAAIIETFLEAYGSRLRQPGEPVPTDASFIEAAAASGYTRSAIVHPTKKIAGDDRDIAEVTVGEVLALSRGERAQAGFYAGLGLMGHRAGELSGQSQGAELS